MGSILEVSNAAGLGKGYLSLGLLVCFDRDSSLDMAFVRGNDEELLSSALSMLAVARLPTEAKPQIVPQQNWSRMKTLTIDRYLKRRRSERIIHGTVGVVNSERNAGDLDPSSEPAA